MKNQPSCSLTIIQLQRARIWYISHKDHVDRMASLVTLSYAPSDSEDKNNPALWKPHHWRWFLKLEGKIND